jgi:hypothetical protein
MVVLCVCFITFLFYHFCHTGIGLHRNITLYGVCGSIRRMGPVLVFPSGGSEKAIDLRGFSPVDLWDMRSLYLQGVFSRAIKRELCLYSRYCVGDVLDQMGLMANAHWKKRRARTARRKMLWAKYGISVKDYSRLLEHQDNKCFLCGLMDFSREHGQRLSVDHDHVTGVVRGLLCNRCNVFVGHIETMLRRGTCCWSFLLRTLVYIKFPPAEKM